MKRENKLFTNIFISIIFGTAFYIRYCGISLLPINHDESGWAVALMSKTEFIKRFLGIPLTCFSPHIKFLLVNYLSSPGIINLREIIYQIRFPSVIIGAVTVAMLYLLAKQMYGQIAAVISSIFLCFLPWHIILSRIACRVIWIPLLGCLIFLGLFKAVQEKNNIRAYLWFLFTAFFLNKALRAYESGILFIPIVFIALFFLIREKNSFMNLKKFVVIIITIFLFSGPFIFKIIKGGDEFWHDFYRAYHINIFKGVFLSNLWANFRNNIGSIFHLLFFTNDSSSFLYGEALKAPLLINPIMLIILQVSLISSIWRRKIEDKILLTWLLLGFLGVIMGVNFVEARYIFIILPPLIILIGRFFASIFERRFFCKTFFKRNISFVIVWIVIVWLVSTEIIQWRRCYYMATYDLDENIQNSYGCKEAAVYLLQQQDIIDNYKIFMDNRMTVDVYLRAYLLEKGKTYKCTSSLLSIYKTGIEKGIYVLWTPESHPQDYGGGMYRLRYDFFKKMNPQISPVKIIYYPNGLPAIYLFKLDGENINA